MTKEMIISSSAHETRVAILEEDQVAEIFIERERSRGVVGNLYKGRVSKVLPGMQSAFVDLGLERDGFLYVTDVIATFEEFDRLETDEDEPAVAGAWNGAPASARQVRPRQRAWPTRRPPRPRAREGPRAEDRRAPEGRPGDHRPGGQGAARHQGRAADLARDDARPVPGVHADGRPRRRLPQDRLARRAQPPARHRPRVPRAARLHRRRDHPHRRRRAGRRKTSSRTSATSTRSGPRSARSPRRRARRRSSTRSRASSPSCCATC